MLHLTALWRKHIRWIQASLLIPISAKRGKGILNTASDIMKVIYCIWKVQIHTRANGVLGVVTNTCTQRELTAFVIMKVKSTEKFKYLCYLQMVWKVHLCNVNLRMQNASGFSQYKVTYTLSTNQEEKNHQNLKKKYVPCHCKQC